MELSALENKKIAILGFGLEGRALYNFLLSNGIENITIFDEKLRIEEIEEDIRHRVVIGEFRSEKLNEFDVVFRSPGVPYERVKKMVPEKVEITSAIDLFLSNSRLKVVGVTGTKGKSTTAKLIERVLLANGKKAYLGGNIGVVPLQYLDYPDDGTVILELSSFQLEGLCRSPQTAIILPISMDHLDYHKNGEEYTRAKSSICQFQSKNDTAIYFNDGKSKDMALLSMGSRTPYSTIEIEEGCFPYREGVICKSGAIVTEFAEILNYSIKYKIPLVNIIASVAFAYSMGLEFDPNKIFEGFKKMPFRIEPVGEKNGTIFYNDSASTNPISTIEAVKTFTEPYYLIAGGSSKGLDFKGMAEFLKNDTSLRAIFLIGNTASEINRALIEAGFSGKIVVKEKLEEVFSDLCKDLSDVKSVLFSPASASFDQYKNYVERGESFNKLVAAL